MQPESAPDAESLYQQGLSQMAQGQTPIAADLFAQAVEINPGNLHYKESLVESLKSFSANQSNARLKNLMTLCLKTPDLDMTRLGGLWFSLLKHDARLGDAFKNLDHEQYSDFKAALTELEDPEIFLDPFFTEGLKKVIVTSISFERFLTHLRRALLEGKTPFQDNNLTVLGTALALYCFEAAYVFEISEEENLKLVMLRPENESSIAIMACYAPLFTHEKCREISEIFKTPHLSDLIQTQITDVLERQKIKGHIAPLTPISTGVSEAVREQYEEFPYPKWKNISKETIAQKQKCQSTGAGTKILVAGCGTGWEAVEIACAFPEAEVLAIDLSKTSLAYAIQQTQKIGIENITYKHADILKLDDHDTAYDFIASSGVLHHMEDPRKGWRILTNLLKPGCAMRVGLYSEIARRHIVEARRVIAKEGYSSDADSMRKFRKNAPELLERKTYEYIKTLRDYYILPECRDLLFHAQEHRFTLPQVEDALNDLGLDFLGFYLGEDIQHDYAAQFPHDTTGTDLKSWAKYEEQNPDTFIEMYRFWCIKN